MEAGKPTHVVYYDCFDEDKILFVKRAEDVTKNDVVVHSGGYKSCRVHAHANQPQGKAKSLRRLPPYES